MLPTGAQAGNPGAAVVDPQPLDDCFGPLVPPGFYDFLLNDPLGRAVHDLSGFYYRLQQEVYALGIYTGEQLRGLPCAAAAAYAAVTAPVCRFAGICS